ncbi:MAG: hypothetical protein HZB39_16095 [Planctomycetes bacterium]|nr:hypothetical protein [Planctomycetota bacterium]
MLRHAPDLSPRRPALQLPATHWLALRETLAHCAGRVPLYRGVVGPDRDADAEPAAREALARFLVLSKDALRKAFPHRLVPDGESLAAALKDGRILFVGTSGTTGERVQVLWDQIWWDTQERDGFALHPISRRHTQAPDFRQAVLTTPVCSGNLCHVGALPMQERIDGNVLFLNQAQDPALWSEKDVMRMADELEAFAPHSLEADPAYLAHFSVRLSRLGREPFAPGFIDLSYEFPSRRHVAAIAKVFRAPILDAYGSTECGFPFMECEHGRYHHNSAWSHAELLPLDHLDGLRGVARLLITTLRNPWLNLVRFDTGDLVREAQDACACGRDDGLVLASLEGRVSDLVRATDGRLVTVRSVDRALADVDGLLHWRLRQHGATSFELDLLGDGSRNVAAEHVAAMLTGLLGVAPRARVVSNLPVEASGKYRLCAALHEDLAGVARA